MESTARLDYVLFQLTPTRTRCDLVIFSGKLNEKLASGLLEPFLAHLQSAKDQISKGGYSITLRPPSSSNAYWFTKATIQRFVRFVSTPEVLERFVTIEREIAQLENSIKSYEASNADVGNGTEVDGNAATGENSKNSAASFKLKGEYSESSDPLQEENSKVRLQRVVETRKAVLQKEQAMVYARALAAGFEMDNLDDLLFFADAFGASRLREACINFKDLCKKKNEDRLWVDEIAAMQAIVQPDLSYMGTSGIVLAGEDNDRAENFMIGGKQNSSTDVSMSDSITSHGSLDANQAQNPPTDVKAQMASPWANQYPSYLQNFQVPVYQQMPPYQGYVFPGMPGAPPYYPANMRWPPNVNVSIDRDLHDRRDHKSSSGTETESDASSDHSHRKKHGKTSSRKVVIRNINYITSKRNGEKNGVSEVVSSDEDDEDQKSTSLRHRKHNGSKQLSSFDKNDENDSLKNNNGNKGTENWAALQQLLLREETDSNGREAQTVNVEEEYFTTKRSEEQNSYALKLEAEEKPMQRLVPTDTFLVPERGTENDSTAGRISVQNFDPSETSQSVTKKGSASASEEFLFSHRLGEPESYARVTLSGDHAARSSMIKSQTSDDWFIRKQSNEAANLGEKSDLRFIDGDYITSSADQKKKDVIIDDSLMIQGRHADDYSDSQSRTHISLVSDIVEASVIENGMSQVPQRKAESLVYCEPDDLYIVLDRDAAVEQTVASWTPEMDYANNVSVNDLVKRHSDEDVCADSNSMPNQTGDKNKKTGASVTKASSKDARSRVFAGPLRKGKPEATPGIRRSTFGSKTGAPKSHLEKEEERRKRMEELLLQRQKRIAEKSAGTGGSAVASKKPQTGSKAVTASLGSDKSKLQSSAEEKKKPKAILRSSTIDRLAVAKTTPNIATARSQTGRPKKEASKASVGNVKSGSQKTIGVDTKKTNTNKKRPSEKKSEDQIDSSAKSRDLNSMQGPYPSSEVDDSIDIKELHVTSSVINKNEKEVNVLEDQTANLDSTKDNKNEISEDSFSFPEERDGPHLSVHPVPESPIKGLTSAVIIEEKSLTNQNDPRSPEISEIEESTPPTNGMNFDPIQSRRKWDSAESSPKAAKGFRKLLIFARKS